MDTARKNQIIRLITIWVTTLLLSVSSMGISVYVLTRDRINYSCESNGHGFEPRYDSIPPAAKEIQDLKMSWHASKLEAIEKMRRNIYVGDVCHYCGKTVKRQ